MNFMNGLEGETTELELKYCERCGGLWLRPQGETQVYCAGCRARVAQFLRLPEERDKRPRLPRPRREDIQCQMQIALLQGIADIEVRR